MDKLVFVELVQHSIHVPTNLFSNELPRSVPLTVYWALKVRLAKEKLKNRADKKVWQISAIHVTDQAAVIVVARSFLMGTWSSPFFLSSSLQGIGKAQAAVSELSVTLILFYLSPIIFV